MMLPGKSRLAIYLVSVLVGTFAFISAAHAEKGGPCIPVHAVIKSKTTAENCTSPIGLCTEGRIRRGGFLNGKTFFTALELGSTVDPDSQSYSGTLRVRTRHGTLDIEDVGILQADTGAFTEIDHIVGGTGRFANASGTLFISGFGSDDVTSFKGKIRGRICLAN